MVIIYELTPTNLRLFLLVYLIIITEILNFEKGYNISRYNTLYLQRY